MLTKPSHALPLAILILTCWSGSNADCPPQTGVTFARDDCCTNNVCAANCTAVAVACADGYTGTATTANCTADNTWSKDVTNVCTRVCQTPTGSTVTADCCFDNVCVIGCSNVVISCQAAYSGDDVTANCQADGNWSVANVASTCSADCPKQAGVTFIKSTCCADNSCDAGCTGVTISCAPGYSGTNTTANCGSNSAWNRNITTICMKEMTTTAATTAATCGAGDMSLKKITVLFVSSLMMLNF